MKTLYLDCTSGISGDMFVAALLDLGADEQAVDKALSKISGDGFHIVIGRKLRNGIDCLDFDVVMHEGFENKDHDMEYLYGHHHQHHHSEDAHHSEHEHSGHEHSGHGHRKLGEVKDIIAGLDMTTGARELAYRIFEILAEGEAKAHGKSVEEVHFHEVGALDSIADVVAAAVCFDNLGIEEVIIPKICEGKGTVRTQHGILPIPVPAVLAIAEKYSLPIRITEREGEFITPTGAAIAAAIMTSSKTDLTFIPKATGYGSGKREYDPPSILRATIIEPVEKAEEEVIWKLETNIDDTTGEILGYTMDLLLAAGARDVYFTPIHMKKNRPAYMLSVLTTEDKIGTLEDIIFRETTTIGIRRCLMERRVLPRRTETVETRYGEAIVKVVDVEGERRIYPEYDSMVRLAKEAGISLKAAYNSAMQSYADSKK
ncbi:MAG: nickel pincer cofactor biosynthesis protein LarC [Lachnospiraceae bacterium]|nr:nickel pincer cofactor biosynthesis protein LarC [Lachnospiraceae bacterium]